MQVVYNANTLAKLVKQKKKLQNWLVYYTNKFSRNDTKKPTTKVLNLLIYLVYLLFCVWSKSMHITFIFFQTGFLGLCGTRVDAIEYYTSEIEKVSNEVSTA